MKFVVVSDKTIERAIVESSILGDMKSEKQLEKERLDKLEKERLEKERLEKENNNKSNDNVGAQGGTNGAQGGTNGTQGSQSTNTIKKI